MMNKNTENNFENKSALSTGAHGGLFEIHVKGHLDESLDRLVGRNGDEVIG